MILSRVPMRAAAWECVRGCTRRRPGGYILSPYGGCGRHRRARAAGYAGRRRPSRCISCSLKPPLGPVWPAQCRFAAEMTMRGRRRPYPANYTRTP